MDASNATNATGSAGVDLVSPYMNTLSSQSIAAQTLGLMAIFLDLPCFVWHLKNRNLPASMMVGWVVLHNLMKVVNAFIWPIDDLSTFWDGIGYCDITTKLDVMGQLAKIACALCILRALARALDTNRPSLSAATGRELWLHRAFEWSFCIGCPILYGIGQWIISERRYEIGAIAGCEYSFGLSWAYFPLFGIWMPVLCCISCYYATMIIVRLRRYKREFASVLASSNTGLSKSRFLRLLGVSVVFIVGYLPYSMYGLWVFSTTMIEPFSFAELHDPRTWQTILVWQSFGQVRMDTWIRISEGIVVFAVFGFGKDISSIYSRILTSLGLTRAYHSVTRSLPSPAFSKTSLRKASIFSRKSRRTASTSSTSSGSAPSKLKVRAKSVLARLVVLPHSPHSSRHRRANASVSTTSVGSPPPPPYKSAPPTPFAPRPTGLAEKDLYDLDIEAIAESPTTSASNSPVLSEKTLDHTITTMTAAPLRSPTHPSPSGSLVVSHEHVDLISPTPTSATLVSPRNEQHIDAGPVTPAEPRRALHRARSSELAMPSRSRFWTRLNNYVDGMGPRPAANMGTMTGARAAAAGTGAGGLAEGPRDLVLLRAGEYEERMIDALI